MNEIRRISSAFYNMGIKYAVIVLGAGEYQKTSASVEEWLVNNSQGHASYDDTEDKDCLVVYSMGVKLVIWDEYALLRKYEK